MPQFARSVRIAAFAALAGTAGLLPSGCAPWSVGGQMSSTNSGAIPSTWDKPTTFVLVDTRTNQDIWTYDIPVDKKLIYQLADDQMDDSHPAGPRVSVIYWEIRPITEDWGSPANKTVLSSITSFRNQQVRIEQRINRATPAYAEGEPKPLTPPPAPPKPEGAMGYGPGPGHDAPPPPPPPAPPTDNPPPAPPAPPAPLEPQSPAPPATPPAPEAPTK